MIIRLVCISDLAFTPEPLIFPLKLFCISSPHVSQWHYNSTQFFKNVAGTISSTSRIYSRSAHFSPWPPPSSKSVSSLTCDSKRAPDFICLLHSCHPPPCHSPFSRKQPEWSFKKTNQNMFAPLAKAFWWLPAAVEGIFFTLTYKSSKTRPPLLPQLLTAPISHSPTSLNQHKLFPTPRPSPLLFPVPGIPSPRLLAVSHSIKPPPKCHPLKEFPFLPHPLSLSLHSRFSLVRVHCTTWHALHWLACSLAPL